ncbi:MAG: peptide ABC transporter substrate-binding protein [Verrucomicrobiota bacterium]
MFFRNFIFLIFIFVIGCNQRPAGVDFIFVNGDEPQSLDPAIISGQLDMRMAKALFEGLYTYGPDASIKPGIATHHDLSEDGLTYTFYLRSDATWSNGDKVTAYDFEKSWRRVLEPTTASKYSEIMYFIHNAEAYNKGELFDFKKVGIEALNELTFQVTLHSPAAYFQGLTAFATYLPVHLSTIKKYGDAWIKPEHMVSNGPYLLEDWRIKDRIRLKKNPNYWNAESVKFNRIDALATSSASTAFNLYETGQVDLILDKTMIPGMLMGELSEREDMHSYIYLGTYFFRMNMTRPFLQDSKVRKALALSVDKEKIVNKITRGGEQPARTFCTPGINKYQPPEGLGFDPEAASKLMSEAGYPNGEGFPRISILYNKSELNQQIAVELQAMWKEHLNIDIDLRLQEWATYLRSMDNLDYDIARSSWIGDYVDPNTFLDCFVTGRGNNRTGWSNPRYDALLEQANLNLDPVQRAELLKDAERILVEEDMPIIPVYHVAGKLLYRKNKLGGIQPNVLAEHPLQYLYWKE